jgi:hypothetical protein
MPPPDTEMRRTAFLAEDGPKNRKPALSNIETAIAPLDLQASRLQRIYFFADCTARTVAALAFGGLAR